MAELIIKNKKEFDQQVWQYETGFTTAQYQNCIDNFADVASRIYDIIDQHDDIPVDPADLYQLGDLINMLSCLKVDVEHCGESWTCTRGDFEDYILDGISEDTINDMIDDVAHGMCNNDCVADCYWQHVSMTAKEHGLQKKADVIDLAKEAVNSPEMRYATCTICTKDDHERIGGVIIALYEYDVDTEKDDDEIYFYAGSAAEFIRICQEGADEFTICAIDEFSTEI